MFRRSSEPLALSEASLLALRPSLNTPVLNTDFLPVGPACAAIVVFAEEYGGIGLAIGVRSNEGGQIAVFRNQEPIDASTRITDALEPALATAERMGFLFDEDLIESVHEGQGRTQAMALWGGLMGELEMPVGPTTNELVGKSPDDSATSYSGLDATVPELLLDDVAPLESPDISLDLDLDLDLDNELQTSASVARPKPARHALSKFRNESPAPKENTAVPKDETDEPGPETDDPSSTLGRIPLRRVRRGGSKRVPFLARLLSSF